MDIPFQFELPESLAGWKLIAVVPTDTVVPGSRELWFQDPANGMVRAVSVNTGPESKGRTTSRRTTGMS